MFDPQFSVPPPPGNEQSGETKIVSKCPCCRQNTSKMLCVVCALQQLRVAKVREKYRELFMQKVELCHKIEQELKPEVCCLNVVFLNLFLIPHFVHFQIF